MSCTMLPWSLTHIFFINGCLGKSSMFPGRTDIRCANICFWSDKFNILAFSPQPGCCAGGWQPGAAGPGVLCWGCWGRLQGPTELCSSPTCSSPQRSGGERYPDHHSCSALGGQTGVHPNIPNVDEKQNNKWRSGELNTVGSKLWFQVYVSWTSANDLCLPSASTRAVMNWIRVMQPPSAAWWRGVAPFSSLSVRTSGFFFTRFSRRHRSPLSVNLIANEWKSRDTRSL